ncbi:MAG: hypothetical protein ACR2G4_10620 [Pyrinomonadaceae bacterium]
MRGALITVLITTACCLSFPHEVKAQAVYSYADIYYDDTSNSMVFTVEAGLDYTTEAYYCISVYGYSYKNEELQISFGDSVCSQTEFRAAQAQSTLPYDPNAEFDVESIPILETYLRNIDEEEGGGGVSGNDYFNFSAYEVGSPVIYPIYYNFIGGGPLRRGVSSIILGLVNAAWSAGALAGPPHHLKLISDTTPITSCGSKRRLLKFRVVDSTGRGVGTTSTKETFEDPNNSSIIWPSIYNSCQNQNFSPPSCSEDRGGIFTDQLWVGCPSSGGTCGFPAVGSRWWWCPRGRPHISLSTNLYEIGHNSVKINGNENPYPEGYEFY